MEKENCCNESKKLENDDKTQKKSLYDELGGHDAIELVVNDFYKNVMADDRINHYFEEVNMKVQKLHQTNFLCFAFGGPNKFQGKDLRTAHSHLKLTEDDFKAVAENLIKTLKNFKIPDDKINDVMTIVASTHDDVLNL